jgi:hypothetical protein
MLWLSTILTLMIDSVLEQVLAVNNNPEVAEFMAEQARLTNSDNLK